MNKAVTECNIAVLKNVGKLPLLYPKTKELIFFQQILAYAKILKIMQNLFKIQHLNTKRL